MKEKKSFYEIIFGKMNGKWCEGIMMMDVSCEEIEIFNIYCGNGKVNRIDNYPILTNEKIFSQVVEMDYEEALRELTVNNKTIISPKVYTDEIMTFEGSKCIHLGGNVFCKTEKNNIIVNDTHYFDNFNEILKNGFVNSKEMEGKWQVF